MDDLIQSTALRLLENDCALLKRFCGETDDDLFAYLAIVTRSVVRSWGRCRNASKRTGRKEDGSSFKFWAFCLSDSIYPSPERAILAKEVAILVNRVLGDKSRFSDRDRLICRLYFDEDLSAAQIARCHGIGLSKSGVLKVLNRIRLQTRSIVESGEHYPGLKPPALIPGTNCSPGLKPPATAELQCCDRYLQ